MYYIDQKKFEERLLKEHIELHKKCIITYLMQRDASLKVRKKFLILYSYYIDESNILNYFHKPIHIFVKALITGKLPKIADKYQTPKNPKKR